MRVISQDGTIDVPYEQVVMFICEECARKVNPERVKR